MATYKGVVPYGKYTFYPATKIIELHADYSGIALSDIMLITNVKSGTAITIYDPFDPAKGGTLSLVGGVITLTLNYNTTAMSNTDPLQIIVGMVNLPTSLPTGAATENTLSALNTKIPSNLTVTSTRLLVDGSNVTQPVSLLSLPSLAAGSNTIGSISNISGTISLPTGAATESTLSTLSGKVPSGLTVTSTRLLVDISGSISNTSFAATQSTASSLLNKPYGAVTTAAPTYTTGTDNALSLTTAGALRVDGSGVTQNVSVQNSSLTVAQATAANLNATVSQAGTWNIGTLSTITNAVTVSQGTATSLKTQAENYQGGTAVGSGNPLQVTLANTGANATAIKVDGTGNTFPATQSGTWTVQPGNTANTTPWLTRLSDGNNNVAIKPSTTPAAATDPALVVAISPNNSLSITGSVTANAGTNLNTSALAVESGGNLASIKTNTDNLALAQGSTTSGQKGNLAMASVSSSAPAPTTGTTQALSLTTAGELRVGSDGCTAYQVVSSTGQNLALIKLGATKVYGWYIYNNAAYPKKVILYDAASTGSVTVGTSPNPLVTLVIPASSGANVSLPVPLAVSSGLCIAMTGGASASTTMQNNDTTNVTLNDLNVNILYK